MHFSWLAGLYCMLTDQYPHTWQLTAVMPVDRPDEQLSFYDIMKRGREKHEIVIGYKNIHEKRPSVNPANKAAKCLTLADIEAVVVLSHMAVARACFHSESAQNLIASHQGSGSTRQSENGECVSSVAAVLPHPPPQTPFD